MSSSKLRSSRSPSSTSLPMSSRLTATIPASKIKLGLATGAPLQTLTLFQAFHFAFALVVPCECPTLSHLSSADFSVHQSSSRSLSSLSRSTSLLARPLPMLPSAEPRRRSPTPSSLRTSSAEAPPVNPELFSIMESTLVPSQRRSLDYSCRRIGCSTSIRTERPATGLLRREQRGVRTTW